MRIRHRCNLRAWKLPRHPQRQRTPATAKFEDRLPIGKVSVRDGLAQRFFLSLLQRGFGLLVVTAGIFAVRTEHAGEECRGYFVMLGIGLVGVPGNGARCHFVRKQGVALRVGAGQPRRSARAQPLHGGADHEIRQRYPFGGADDLGCEAHVTTPVAMAAEKQAGARGPRSCKTPVDWLRHRRFIKCPLHLSPVSPRSSLIPPQTHPYWPFFPAPLCHIGGPNGGSSQWMTS